MRRDRSLRFVFEDVVGVFRIDDGNGGTGLGQGFEEDAVGLPVDLNVLLADDDQGRCGDRGQEGRRIHGPQLTGKGLVDWSAHAEYEVSHHLGQVGIHGYGTTGREIGDGVIVGGKKAVAVRNRGQHGGDLGSASAPMTRPGGAVRTRPQNGVLDSVAAAWAW